MKPICTVSGGAFALILSCVTPAVAQDMDAATATSVMRGAQLYDKWWKITGGAEPTETHEAYPAESAKDGSTTWRCKECHGWDYIGADGRYSSGSHFTGIPGVAGLKGGDTAAIRAAIRGGSHGFGADILDDASIADLANFIALGQVDIASHVSDNMSTGDATAGGAVYVTVCAGCHGVDGMKINEMPALSELANDNPQEIMHKVLYGQPDEAMPGLFTFGPQTAADVVAYLATLPM